MVKPFEEAVFGLKPAKSRPGRNQFGYHIIKLDEIKPAESSNFESAKTKLEEEAQDQRPRLCAAGR
jgi:parvulin-like peptidyl-prolyl isomerase